MKSKKILVAIPVRLLEQMEVLAKRRFQNRSELIREALRTIVENNRVAGAPSVVPFPAPQQEQSQINN